MLGHMLYQGGALAESIARWVVDNPMVAAALLFAALFALIRSAIRATFQAQGGR
jgi:hypothetical protein